MTGPGNALLVLWNDVDPALAAEYEDWHANEHVPERLTVPGIVWARRYARMDEGTMPRYLTLYGLRDRDVLESDAYRRLLREPTPASRRMRPALRNICRWVCELLHDRSGAATSVAVRLLPLRAFDGLSQTGEGSTVARRYPDAADLPWLGDGQGRSIEGDWFVCEAQDGETPVAPGDSLFERLPILGEQRAA